MSRAPRRLVNQLESGTSPSVFTLRAGPHDRDRLAERFVDELVALREVELRDRRDVADVGVAPDRIVGVEPLRSSRPRSVDRRAARPGGADDEQRWHRRAVTRQTSGERGPQNERG